MSGSVEALELERGSGPVQRVEEVADRLSLQHLAISCDPQLEIAIEPVQQTSRAIVQRPDDRNLLSGYHAISLSTQSAGDLC